MLEQDRCARVQSFIGEIAIGALYSILHHQEQRQVVEHDTEKHETTFQTLVRYGLYFLLVIIYD